jgi:hypothetical protein
MPSPWATVIGVLVDIWVETTKLTGFQEEGKRRHFAVNPALQLARRIF